MNRRTGQTAGQGTSNERSSASNIVGGIQLGILILCLVGALAFAQTPVGATHASPVQSDQIAPPQQVQPRRQTAEPADQDQRMAGRRRVLTAILELLQRQASQTEAALREHAGPGDQQGAALRSELAAIQEQMQIVQSQIRRLPSMEQAGAPGTYEQSQQPSPATETTPGEGETPSDRTRERLRAQYEAALKAREQAGQPAIPPTQVQQVPPPAPQRQEVQPGTDMQVQMEREMDRMTRWVQAQFRQYQQGLDEQQVQTNRQLARLDGRMQDIDGQLAELNRKAQQQPAAPTPEELKARAAQENVMQQQNEEIRRQQEQLQKQQQELEKQQREFERQQTEFRTQFQQLQQLYRTAGERGGQSATALREQTRQLQAAVMQIRQRLTQLPSAEDEEDLADTLDDLQIQVDALQNDMVQTHALVNAMLSQSGRSTVGSAGFTWGW
jgi:hypothetical protein